MSLPRNRRGAWAVSAPVLLVFVVLGGTSGCGRQEKSQPAPNPNTSTDPKAKGDKIQDSSPPPVAPVVVIQETTVKDFLASADKGKAILSEVKEPDDVDQAIERLKKEGDNVQSIIVKLEREGSLSQPLKLYTGRHLTNVLDGVREATRNLPQGLPEDKRQALGNAAQRFAGLIRQFMDVAAKLKVTAPGS